MTWVFLLLNCPLERGRCEVVKTAPSIHYFALQRCERDLSQVRYALPDGRRLVKACEPTRW